MVYTLLIPQLPAALAPPALFAAGSALLHAAAWLLYHTAALTIPLALWAAFAADGSLALTPVAAAAAAQVMPAASAPVPLPAPLGGHRGAGLLLLPLLLVALRLAEAAVLRRRQERWEAARRAVTTADVQARYARWALPGSSAGGASPSAAAAAAHAALAQQEQRQQLAALQHEVAQLWQAVYGELLPAHQLQSLQGEGAGECSCTVCCTQPPDSEPCRPPPHACCRAGHTAPRRCPAPACADVAAAVGRLCKDTGVQVPAAAAAAGSDDNAALLLGLVAQIKAAVGLA